MGKLVAWALPAVSIVAHAIRRALYNALFRPPCPLSQCSYTPTRGNVPNEDRLIVSPSSTPPTGRGALQASDW